MKYILLFLCILCLSCKYNVANPVGTLKDYTAGSGKTYYVSSSSSVAEIEEALRKNKHSLGKYKLVVTNSGNSDNILSNITFTLTNNLSFSNVEVDITKLTNLFEITNGAFSNAKNLSSISLSDEVTNIGTNAFSGCFSLTNIRFSGGLTDILDGAFSNCSALTLVMLSSDKLTNISNNAFYNNSSLKNLVLPANISNVCNTAFSGCGQLKNIEYLGTNTNVNGSPFASSNLKGNNSNPTDLYLPSATNTTISSYFSGKSFLGKTWNSSNIHTKQHIPN